MVRVIDLLAGMVTFLLLVVLSGSLALADGGKGVAVNPLTPSAGGEVTVKGDLLGANSTVEVRVVGNGRNVDLGEVQADAEGDFTAKFRLPSDLPAGRYQIVAKGAESATTEVTILAAGDLASPQGMAADAPARERPLAENALLVALFGALAGLGLFFARTANSSALGGR